MVEFNANPKWYGIFTKLSFLTKCSFFEISVGGQKQGRILFELFADVVPRTAEK
jgi:hypothetical protein